jgi:hypothetical protein
MLDAVAIRHADRLGNLWFERQNLGTFLDGTAPAWVTLGDAVTQLDLGIFRWILQSSFRSAYLKPWSSASSIVRKRCVKAGST